MKASNSSVTILLQLLLVSTISCQGNGKNNIADPKLVYHIDSVSQWADTLPEFKNDPHIKETQGNQISGVVRMMYQDKSGNLWFATQNGLSRYDGTSLLYFDIQNERHKSSTVKTIVEDKEGVIWAGSSTGLIKFDGTYFTLYTENDGLLSNDIWALETTEDGLVWIGTVKGACTFDGTVFSAFELPKGIKDPRRGVSTAEMVHNIFADNQGGVWFATNAGLFVYRNDELTKSGENSEMQTNFIGSVLQDSDGMLWVNTFHDGVYIEQGDSFKRYLGDTNLIALPLEVRLIDQKGGIWLSTQGERMIRYHGNKTDSYTGDGRFEKHLPFQLYEDRSGRIWSVGLYGAYRLEGDTFINVNRRGPW